MSGGTVRGPGAWPGPKEGPAPGPASPAADATAPDGAGSTDTWPMLAAPAGVGRGVTTEAAHGLFLDEDDIRPRTMLDRDPVDRAQALAGTLATAVIHVAMPLLGLAMVAALRAAGVIAPPDAERPPPPEIENVVAARFVVLGEELDPRMLPDRIVPILRTDTPEPRDAPSLRERPEPPPERERRERDRRAVDDAIRRLSEDAQIFAEREEARIREGSPEGIEEGTERRGTEGDIYRGRLYTFFRRGWTVPTTLSEAQLRDLQCVAMVEIALDTRIVGWRLSRRSGNAEFDASVEAQLTRITASEPNIPAPPDEVADQYLGREIAIRFHGRDARR